jgi:hypothetical protein
MAHRLLVIVVLAVVSVGFIPSKAAAYYGVTGLSYEPPGEGGDTLSGYSGTYRTPWDPVGGSWYDYTCECYIYWETWVTLVAQLRRPTNSVAGGGIDTDVFAAELFLNDYPPDEPGIWTALGDHYVTQRYWDPGGYYCGGWQPCEQISTYSWGTWAQARVARCGDERDDIIEQYPLRQVPWTPGCDDFTQAVPTDSFFGFEDWRSRDQAWSWAILREHMVANNYCVLSNFGPAAWDLRSGYRTPNHNAGTSGSAGNSRHMHGDAADTGANLQSDWDYLRFLAKDSGACGFACVEPRDLAPTWFHQDYRGACPGGW